jgi:phenylacetate-CoA ligase
MALRKKLHSYFSRCALPLLLTLQQTLVASKKRTARHIQHGLSFRAESDGWDVTAKKQWILDRLRWVLRDAAANTTYYARLFHDLGFNPQSDFTFEEFARIPALERSTVLNNGRALISQARPMAHLLPNASGGSSGQPVKIWVGPQELGWNLSGIRYFARKLGFSPGASVAFLWGHHLDPGHEPSLARKSIFLVRNERWFDCFRLSDDVLLEYHFAMERFQPDHIIAYASALGMFADFLRRKSLAPNYPTKCILTGAEKLFDYQREAAESVFRCPVYERYGARDAGLIGYQIPDEQSRDFIVDWCNTFVEPETPDQESAILVTKLHADGMPMIRYRVGDVGKFPPGSRPGSPSMRLESVIGRTVDRIWMRDGRYIHGTQFPHMFKDFPVREFMVVQSEDYSLEIQLVPNSTFCKQNEQAILNLIGKNLPGLVVRIVKTDFIPKTIANKWRPVISRVAR